MDTAEVRVEYEDIYLSYVRELEEIEDVMEHGLYDVRICLSLIRSAKRVFHDFNGFLREEIELAREYTVKVANYTLVQVEEMKKERFLHLANIYKDHEGDDILQLTLLSRNNFVPVNPVHVEQQVLHEVQAAVLPGQVMEGPSQGEVVRQVVHGVDEVVHEVPDIAVGQFVQEDTQDGRHFQDPPACKCSISKVKTSDFEVCSWTKWDCTHFRFVYQEDDDLVQDIDCDVGTPAQEDVGGAAFQVDLLERCLMYEAPTVEAAAIHVPDGGGRKQVLDGEADGKYDVLAWYLLLLFKVFSADKQPEDGGLSLRAVPLEGPQEAPPPVVLHVEVVWEVGHRWLGWWKLFTRCRTLEENDYFIVMFKLF